MSQNPRIYYFYIAVAVLCAVSLVWIIQDSNNPDLSNRVSDSVLIDTLIHSEELDSVRAKQGNNRDNPELNMQMANLLFDNQRYREAITFYRKTLSFRPDFIAAQIDLSICFYNLEIIDTALVEMEIALKIDPGHLKGLYNMGVMYYNTAQVDSAKYFWLQLLEKHPNSREADIARGILNNLNI